MCSPYTGRQSSSAPQERPDSEKQRVEGKRHAQGSRDLLGSRPLGGLEDAVISRVSSYWDLGDGGKFNILQNLT